MNLHFAPALPADASTLSSIAWCSKQYWGYPEEWMNQWKEDLSISEQYLMDEEVEVVKIMDQENTIGFYSLQPNQEYQCLEIGHFWLLPDNIGKGYGKLAFNALLNHLRKKGVNRLVIEADPNAAGFYEQMGLPRSANWKAAFLAGTCRFMK